MSSGTSLLTPVGPGYGVRHDQAVSFVNSQAPPWRRVTSAMSSLRNESAEVVLQEWVKRARVSQREGARLMARFIRDAKREQGRVQRQVGATAHEALLGAAAMLRREVDQLQKGLTGVSHRLAAFEQEQKTKPAARPRRAPARARAKRVQTTTTARKRKDLRKAA